MSQDRKCRDCGKPTQGESFCNEYCKKMYFDTMASFGHKEESAKLILSLPQRNKR